MTLSKWWLMLTKIGIADYDMPSHYGWNEHYLSAWREFYEDGYTPREALDEDTYAGN